MRDWIGKIAIIALGVLTIGLPINRLVDYFLLLVLVLVVALGRVVMRPARWIAAVGLVVAVAAIRILIAPAPIEEGHNVFVTDSTRPNSALESGLPPPVFRYMNEEFNAAYPAERRCGTDVVGCWRFERFRFPDRAYAFSSEGLYSRPEMSRRVDGISFDDPAWLRLGFLNDSAYNWYNGVSDVERGRPDLQWSGRRVLWHQTIPWFLAFRFPAGHVGSRLCWRGTVLWEGADQDFAVLDSSSRTCRTIDAADVGRTIFGVAVRPGSPIEMELTPKTSLRAVQAFDFALMLAALAILVTFLVQPRLERLAVPAASMAVAAATLWLVDPTFFGGLHVHMGGDDGLVHEGYGQLVLKSLAQGNVHAALQGGESVFYFNPGLRYLRALEKSVFGDTNFGYLALLLVLPLAVFLLFRRFAGASLGLLAALLFVTSLGDPLGLSLPQLGIAATFGYPDPVGVGVFVLGLLALVQVNGPRAGRCFLGTMLLALAVFNRPNLFPLAAVIVVGMVAMQSSSKNWRVVAAAVLGFSFVGVMALHNWVFGGVLVPFGANAYIKEVYAVPPSMYLKAAGDLFRLEWSNEAGLAYQQIGRWIRGPMAKQGYGFLHAAQIAVVLHVVLARRRFDPWLRWIAVAALAGHAVALVYVSTPRYHWLTWLLTSLVMFAWLRQMTEPLLQRIFPGVAVLSWPRAIRESVCLTIGRVRNVLVL